MEKIKKIKKNRKKLNLKWGKTTLFLGFSLCFFILIGRLFDLQIIQATNLKEKALQSRSTEQSVEAKRGEIFDRNGKQLAISLDADSVYIIPTLIQEKENKDEIALSLSNILDIPLTEVNKAIAKPKKFSWLKRKISDKQSTKLKEANLPGVRLLAESYRYYPKGTLAAHVLGFLGDRSNDGLERGLVGIEEAYNNILQGKNGILDMESISYNSGINSALGYYSPPEDGKSIVLTIDESIQFLAERELDTIMETTKASGASIICMNPETGEVLALANTPTFDPNNFTLFPAANWRNSTVQDVYEPGSTLKILTAAMAIEEDVIKKNEIFTCTGKYKIGKDSISCWRSYDPHGAETFTEALANSCNPVFAEIGLRLEKKKPGTIYKYLNAFGIGDYTGIEISGEAKGIIIPQNKAVDLDLASIAFGQAIAISPMQLVRAVSAVANEGNLMKTYIVKKIVDSNGLVIDERKPEITRKVISSVTAEKTLAMMMNVVNEGTGKNGAIEGYQVGGKTGTAQKVTQGESYSNDEYVSSFIGVAPINDPKIVILVVVDNPKSSTHGSEVAAPSFQRIAKDVLKYLKIKPTEKIKDPSTEQAKSEGINEITIAKVPNFVTMTKKEAEQLAKNLNFKLEFTSKGACVIKQNVLPTTDNYLGSIVLELGEIKQGGKIFLPDLTGLRLSVVAKILESYSLELSPNGEGIAISQYPSAGNLLLPGDKVSVTFNNKYEKTTNAALKNNLN
ncbi:MAG: penicillin-binding transpeptidase domain-containing protein [Clostridia bacterium]